jgi:glycosyltransferase involved in cell wall biosynthesis
MNIYYWSPFIDSSVATVKAVINSAYSLKKYSNNLIKPTLIDAIGEWQNFEEELNKKEINIIRLQKFKIYNCLPRFGFFKSRFSYILTSIITSHKLYHFFKNRDKNDLIIIHLLSSLPLLLICLFRFNCKFALRISGLPHLNLLRKFLWKLSSLKLTFITCPTSDTKDDLIKQKIFLKKKIFLLRDPSININFINLKKKEPIEDEIKKNKYFLSIGRLTNQKNHKFLIDVFSEFQKNNDNYHLIIIGDGELKIALRKKVADLNLENKIKIIGYRNNVFSYLFNSECFIQSSKWEDPGFAMIEAAASRTPIITSDCKNGPKEFIGNAKAGYIYENFNKSKFLNKIKEFVNDKNNKENKKIIFLKKLNALKEARKYTNYYHYKGLVDIISKFVSIYEK